MHVYYTCFLLQFVDGAIIPQALLLLFFLFVWWIGLESNCDPNHPVQCWARRVFGSSGSGLWFWFPFQQEFGLNRGYRGV